MSSLHFYNSFLSDYDKKEVEKQKRKEQRKKQRAWNKLDHTICHICGGKMKLNIFEKEYPTRRTVGKDFECANHHEWYFDYNGNRKTRTRFITG